jgi:hypothetical protein
MIAFDFNDNTMAFKFHHNVPVKKLILCTLALESSLSGSSQTQKLKGTSRKGLEGVS